MKGSDVEVRIVLADRCSQVDPEQVTGFECVFYTGDDYAVGRELTDFEWDGSVGATVLQWQELEEMPDGVLRYRVTYTLDGEQKVNETNTNYFLKTPVDYEPLDFVTMDELTEVAISAITSSASTEIIGEMISAATSGMASETYVDDSISSARTEWEEYTNSAVTEAVSGLASESYVNSAVTTATSGLASETYVNNYVTSALSGVDDYVFYTSGYMQPWDVRNQDELIDYANTLGNEFHKLRVFIAASGVEEHVYEFHPIALTTTSITLYTNCQGSYFEFGEVWKGTYYKGVTPQQSHWSYWCFDSTDNPMTRAVSALEQQVQNLPSSTAMTQAIADATSGLQQTLVSGTNIKTINNESLLGSGNIDISANTYYVDVSTLTSEQLAQVRGPQGATGAQGIQGVQGERGPQGETGPQGATGPQGERGPQGEKGDTGSQGPQGAAGSGNVSSATINTIWTGTQAQYDALTTYSNDTLYFIDQD